jgi:hypothetical protein
MYVYVDETLSVKWNAIREDASLLFRWIHKIAMMIFSSYGQCQTITCLVS